MIAGVPEALRPVFNHLGTMLSRADASFNQHLIDNAQEFSQQNDNITRLAARTSDAEGRLNLVENGSSAQSVQLADIATTQARMGELIADPQSLVRAPAFDDLVKRADEVAKHGAETVDAVKKLQDRVATLEVNFAAGMPAGPSTETATLASSIATAVGAAVAKELNSSSHMGTSDGVRQPLGTMRAFTERVFKLEKKENYREWASAFKDIANMKKDLLQCLEWAEEQKEPITELTPTIAKVSDSADLVAINKEIFDAVASSVKGPEMVRIKECTLRGHGLELWRKLHKKGILVGVEYADAIENSLNAMKPVAIEHLERQLEIIRDTVRKHDEIADVGMRDSTKRLAVMRVLPQTAVDHVSAVARGTSYDELEAKVLNWIRNQEAMGIVRSKATPMELGEISSSLGPQEPLTTVQQQLATAQKQVAELSAMVKGGGKGQWNSAGKGGGTFGKGSAWSSPGKGKGKGKGKGATPAQIAIRRIEQSGDKVAEVICPTMLRKGYCDFEQRTGKKCRFSHVKNVPPSLAAIEGLITSDLKDYEIKYDARDGTFVCGDCMAPKDGEKPVVASVLASEVAKIAEEMVAEEDEDFEFQVFQPPASTPVFPGR